MNENELYSDMSSELGHIGIDSDGYDDIAKFVIDFHIKNISNIDVEKWIEFREKINHRYGI